MKIDSALDKGDQTDEALIALNQQLCSAQKLILTLASATDLATLQELALAELVNTLDFPCAAISLYDSEVEALSCWFSRNKESSTLLRHTIALKIEMDPVRSEQEIGSLTPVKQAIYQQRPISVENGTPPTINISLNARLTLGKQYIALPLSFQNKPIGILLVTLAHSYKPNDHELLEMLARHIGVVAGGLIQTIRHTYALAVEEERSRIASDIHDTVSQALFGVAYGLNACTEMLPHQPETVQIVKQQLSELQPMVFDALQQIRSVITDVLPSDLSRERFIHRLQKQLKSLSVGRSIQLSTIVTPKFNGWSLEYRHQLMLVTHEAISNIAKHAEANQVSIQLRSYGANLSLTIIDDGKGFDSQNPDSTVGLGLNTMHSRVERLGGMLKLSSKPGQGTYLQAQIPLP